MKVLLVCAAGMSTSMLMKKMQDYAKENGIEDFTVDAEPATSLHNPKDAGFDCILLGPQVSYMQKTVEKKSQGLPLAVIPMKDYGRQNCPEIFKLIDELLA